MKILSVIRTLVETKLRHVISVHAKVRISPHSGTTSDIWSKRSMRQNKDLATAIGFMSRMAGAPHRSVKVAGELQAAQIANGTSHSHVLTTSSMNATRWQGLYKAMT